MCYSTCTSGAHRANGELANVGRRDSCHHQVEEINVSLIKVPRHAPPPPWTSLCSSLATRTEGREERTSHAPRVLWDLLVVQLLLPNHHHTKHMMWHQTKAPRHPHHLRAQQPVTLAAPIQHRVTSIIVTHTAPARSPDALELAELHASLLPWQSGIHRDPHHHVEVYNTIIRVAAPPTHDDLNSRRSDWGRSLAVQDRPTSTTGTGRRGRARPVDVAESIMVMVKMK